MALAWPPTISTGGPGPPDAACRSRSACCGWWTRCCRCSRSCSPPTSRGRCWHPPRRANRPGLRPQAISSPAGIIAAHPAPLNTGFALVQLALGIGFLIPRMVRPAIVGSLTWSVGIWWFSEGLGGLATGHASLVTGAPGAVLLYAVLALAAWPATDHRNPRDPAEAGVTGWFPAAWGILWIGGALPQLLPSQRGTAALGDQIGSTDGVPGWLAGLHHSAGAVLSHGGNAPFIALVAVMTLVGLAGLGGRPWRMAAAAVGTVAATTFWVLGQNIGQLYSGQATDPNTGPFIVLMALALAGMTARPSVPPTNRKITIDANHDGWSMNDP